MRASCSIAVTLWLLLLPKMGWASDEFSISPSICYQLDQRCQVDVKIEWALSAPQSFCIELAENKLACFESSTSGEVTFSIDINETAEFAMVSSQDRQLLDTLTLKVMTQAFMKRKRKRHAWSVIL